MHTTSGHVGRLDASRDVGRYWYLLALSGLVGVVIGVLVLAHPEPSLKLLGVFLGIDLLVVGVLGIAHGFSSQSRSEEGSSEALVGVLAVIAGLLVIRNPGKSLALVVLGFAIYLIVAGALALGRGLAGREMRWFTLARGTLLVVAGTVIIAWPDISVKTLALLAGLSLLAHGVLELGQALLVRRIHRVADP